MHEYSVVQALLDCVEAQTRAHRAGSVTRIEVLLGELSGVDPDLLAAAYALCRESTACANAALTIAPVAARWVCPRCHGVIARGRALRCAGCDIPAHLDGGDEIILQRIELEVT